MKRRFGPLLLLSILFATVPALTGCYIWVDNHPGDVEGSYKSALAKAQHQERDGSFHGQPHSLKIWAYEADEDRVVSLSIPLWIVRKVADHAVEAEADGEDLEKLKTYGLTIDKVLSGSPGLLAAVDSEDGRAVIWLE